MSGVCPKCVAIRDDGAFCEECGVRLVSTGQWKQDRDTLLNTDSAGHHNQQPDSFFTPPIQPRSTEPQNGYLRMENPWKKRKILSWDFS